MPNEIAEVTGQVEEKLELGGVALTLRPLNLNDLVEIERMVGDSRLDTIEGLRGELFLCARKGGYAGTVEDLGALLAPQDVLRARLAVAKLYPKTKPGDDSPNAASPEEGSGPDSSGA
jgi:hypothetical protein